MVEGKVLRKVLLKQDIIFMMMMNSPRGSQGKASLFFRGMAQL